MKSLERWITIKELAETRHISASTQYRERKNGNLKFYQVGRRILYSPQQVADYFAQKSSQA